MKNTMKPVLDPVQTYFPLLDNLCLRSGTTSSVQDVPLLIMDQYRIIHQARLLHCVGPR